MCNAVRDNAMLQLSCKFVNQNEIRISSHRAHLALIMSLMSMGIWLNMSMCSTIPDKAVLQLSTYCICLHVVYNIVVCFIYSRTLAPVATVICWLYPTQNKFYLILSSEFVESKGNPIDLSSGSNYAIDEHEGGTLFVRPSAVGVRIITRIIIGCHFWGVYVSLGARA